jgi:hypothetical protein
MAQFSLFAHHTKDTRVLITREPFCKSAGGKAKFHSSALDTIHNCKREKIECRNYLWSLSYDSLLYLLSTNSSHVFIVQNQMLQEVLLLQLLLFKILRKLRKPLQYRLLICKMSPWLWSALIKTHWTWIARCSKLIMETVMVLFYR